MVSREEQQKRQVLEGVPPSIPAFASSLVHFGISILASMQNVPSGWLRIQRRMACFYLVIVTRRQGVFCQSVTGAGVVASMLIHIFVNMIAADMWMKVWQGRQT